MTLADASNVHAPTPTETKEKKSPDALILLAALVVVALWGLSFFTFGIPGLYIPAVAAVPVIWVILIMITQG
ncbi:hypothetical protein [Thalassovita aquimarina]|uniref:Uncharacterized protein n=1 Tax=Thalassovita aquimarina TaxID=2785917 RepID=A0ABS5HV08_9RHOB|nr:hypothetical protein [Thalassovita aquimarina]MBR9652815.1 hypothetical protein [Thalassovita aquimarina]